MTRILEIFTLNCRINPYSRVLTSTENTKTERETAKVPTTTSNKCKGTRKNKKPQPQLASAVATCPYCEELWSTTGGGWIRCMKCRTLEPRSVCRRSKETKNFFSCLRWLNLTVSLKAYLKVSAHSRWTWWRDIVFIEYGMKSISS